MAVNLSDPREMTGANVVGHDGEKLGKVDNVYLDNDTARPEWVAVATGLFGVHVSLVPLATAEYREGVLRVPYAKRDVQNAPHHDPDAQLSVDEERELFTHYGVEYGGGTDARRGTTDHRADDRTDHRAGARDGNAVGRDVSGPTTDEAMTRSEEELHVGTETRESGRVRLRKYVVTEEEVRTVPVSREEVRVEREPITDANAAAAHDGPAISEEEHEVVLHEERPVVGKETVPKERVRLDTETQRSEEQVSEQVRKEQIETDADESARGTGTGRPRS
jgi:uncharacterized protein (TIGR02271 family)